MFLIKPVQAAVKNPVLKNSESIASNPTGYFETAIQAIITIFFIFGLVYFIYHFIIAGYKMIASQGDPKKFEEAQHGLLYSLIGIIIIFSVFALLKIIGTIFGIRGLNSGSILWPSL